MAKVTLERSCCNCKNRCYSSMFGMDYCIGYEMCSSPEDEVSEAQNCSQFEFGTPEVLEDDSYCPSSTFGDYSPSNPWDAPGMSIRDFI